MRNSEKEYKRERLEIQNTVLSLQGMSFALLDAVCELVSYAKDADSEQRKAQLRQALRYADIVTKLQGEIFK